MRSVLKTIKQHIGERHALRLGWHFLKAFCAALRYGFPARKLTVIGITGTDGKTTTVAMTAHILRGTGHSVGSVSTTECRIGDHTELNVTQKTSMSPFLLQRFLRKIRKANCTHAVIEVSSHGLVQGRVHHIFPHVAAITNTSPEHLDYHKTMEQYRSDKAKLFRMLKGKGTKIINASDDSKNILQEIPSSSTITYGTPQSDLWIENAKQHSHEIWGTVQPENIILRIPIHGLFNLENALAAIGCAKTVGVSTDQAISTLATFHGTEGRIEEIQCDKPFRVFTDFTVTAAAYEKLLQTLQPLRTGEGRLLVLAGACGDRMKEKRPEIGQICSREADVVVITSDESYGEPHELIIDDIWKGIDTETTTAYRVEDRRKALEFILSLAAPGDIVAICGMAGVTTMMTPQGQIEWDERKIVKELLER